MRAELALALGHVAVVCYMCMVTVTVKAPVAGLSTFLAMPCYSLINMAYTLLGLSWLQRDTSVPGYLLLLPKSMDLDTHSTTVLDQWLTLSIFTWLVAWCLTLDQGWRPCLVLCVMGLSLASYSLALLHPWGFEVVIGIHMVVAIGQAMCTYRHQGTIASATHLALGTLSFLGFVGLKLGDHQHQWHPFQHLTGHFWSSVCDVLQLHFALFLTSLNPMAKMLPQSRKPQV
ncbi:LOW QUALITY PROTEIN: transmembrane protein 187 [Ctenodactylus gundi]